MNCPACNVDLKLCLYEDPKVITLPETEKDTGNTVPTSCPSGGIYFPPRSDRAYQFFTILNEIEGGNGTRTDPLRWRAGSFGSLRFKMDYAQIPEYVRKYTFTVRGHLQLTHPCTKIDPYQGTKFTYDQLDEVFEFPIDTIIKKAGEDYLDVTRSNRTIYLNVSDNSQGDDTCFFTSGKLFLREVD